MSAELWCKDYYDVIKDDEDEVFFPDLNNEEENDEEDELVYIERYDDSWTED